MNTLFFSHQGLSPMHQAAEAELMHQATSAGETVYLLHCNAGLLTCSLNSTHNLIGCAICDARCGKTFHKLAIPKDQVFALDRKLFPDSFTGELPVDLPSLMKYSYQGINIGRGVASSVISVLREYQLDIHGKHQELVVLHLRNAIGALVNYVRVLDAVKPDRVVLFNGRHSETWPLISLCEARGIRYATHERGGSNYLYQVFQNSLPHSIATRRGIMNELWDSTPRAEALNAATKWYEAKRLGKHKDDKNYLNKQAQGVMPDGYSPDKHNIVIFNSSEDEMQAIAEWKTDLFQQQNQAILQLLAELSDNDDVHIYIRMHPNLIGVDNQQTRELFLIRQQNVTVVRPEEKTDTYTLMENADVVLCFASSAGVEATFWHTPSVLYGRAFYEGDDAVYEPKSFEELIRLLTTRGLAPKSRQNVLKYGYFVSHFGKPFEYASVVGPNEASIDGEPFGRLNASSGKKMISYLPRLPDWLKAHRVLTGKSLSPFKLSRLFSHIRNE